MERLSKRIQLTFESHFCEYDVRDFSVTFRFCSFLANFSRIWFCISSRLVLPIIRNNCFKENTSKDNLFYAGEFRSEYLLEKDDIITPLTEQAIGLLGTTARIPESGKYIQSQDVALVKCKAGKIDPAFCYYLISSKLVRNQLSVAAQQTKIRHTSPDKIKDCTVWIPELDEQIAIGRLLASLDEKMLLNKQINDNLPMLDRSSITAEVRHAAW